MLYLIAKVFCGFGLAMIDIPSPTLPVMGFGTCIYMKLGKNLVNLDKHNMKFGVLFLHFLFDIQ